MNTNEPFITALHPGERNTSQMQYKSRILVFDQVTRGEQRERRGQDLEV